MYKYEIVNTYPDALSCKFKPSDFNNVINVMLYCLSEEAKKYDGYLTFYLNGKKSSGEQLLQAAEADRDAFWEKKNETHKQISVSTGITAFVKKTVWVRK